MDLFQQLRKLRCFEELSLEVEESAEDSDDESDAPDADCVKRVESMRKLLNQITDADVKAWVEGPKSFCLKSSLGQHSFVFYAKSQLVPQSPAEFENVCPLWYLPVECPQLLPVASASQSMLCLWVQKGNTLHEKPVFMQRDNAGGWALRGLKGECTLRALLEHMGQYLATAGAAWTVEDVLPLDKVITKGKDSHSYVTPAAETD